MSSTLDVLIRLNNPPIDALTFQAPTVYHAELFFILFRSLTIEDVKNIVIDRKLISNRESGFSSKISRITWYHPADSSQLSLLHLVRRLSRRELERMGRIGKRTEQMAQTEPMDSSMATTRHPSPMELKPKPEIRLWCQLRS
jgi:hypothetical protein